MQNFDFEVVMRTWPFLWQGLIFTIEVTLLSALGGVVFGTLLAMARLSSIKPIAWLAGFYVKWSAIHPFVTSYLLVLFFGSLSGSLANWC